MARHSKWTVLVFGVTLLGMLLMVAGCGDTTATADNGYVPDPNSVPAACKSAYFQTGNTGNSVQADKNGQLIKDGYCFAAFHVTDDNATGVKALDSNDIVVVDYTAVDATGKNSSYLMIYPADTVVPLTRYNGSGGLLRWIVPLTVFVLTPVHSVDSSQAVALIKETIAPIDAVFAAAPGFGTSCVYQDITYAVMATMSGVGCQ